MLFLKYRIHQIQDENEEEEAIQEVLENVLRCQYDKIDDARYFVMQAIHLGNAELWKTLWPPNILNILRKLQLKTHAKEKYIPTVMEKSILEDRQHFLRVFCQLFPFQVIKLVRLKLSAVKTLIERLRLVKTESSISSILYKASVNFTPFQFFSVKSIYSVIQLFIEKLISRKFCKV